VAPISDILLLLVAVVASSTIVRTSPVTLPLALVQIALGALIASVFDLRIELEPDSFFLLFLAPLLFLDGWRIPKQGLLHDKGTILALALGLVVFTVVGAGIFINWLIPAMPLAVAFALAATLSPTDAVAVSTITSRAPIPNRLMHILEGESLLNDASGLVCMRFAVAAALTGTFSIVEASGAFLWLAAGGVFIGVAVTLCATVAKNWVSQRFGEEPGSQILISLLIPYGAYLITDHAHASGILAAVAAGITMSYAEQSGRALATTRVRRAAVWDAVQFAVNGVIFVLLGEQFPSILVGAAQVVRETGHQRELWLLAYVGAISCALAALRLFWVWASLGLILFRAAHKGQKVKTPGWRLIAATSLAGVRGAVTLAGVLTLPLTLRDGSPFPARDLAILLAAGVIVVSLIGANVGLPYLLRGAKLPPEPSRQREEDEARVAAADAAIQAINGTLRDSRQKGQDADLYMDAGARVTAIYRQRVQALSTTGEDAKVERKVEEIERRLRLVALDAERAELYRRARSGKLSDELTRRLVREVDLMESRFSAS